MKLLENMNENVTDKSAKNFLWFFWSFTAFFSQMTLLCFSKSHKEYPWEPLVKFMMTKFQTVSNV